MPRTIEVKVTLDDADSEVLEVAAGLMNKDPDELLGEQIAQPMQRALKKLIDDLRPLIRDMNPVARLAIKGSVLAREAATKDEKGRRG